MPVVPDVYSTTVPPGRSRPSASAYFTAASAMRSFMLPVGFAHSSLTSTRAAPRGTTLRSSTSGVLPMPPSTLAATVAMLVLPSPDGTSWPYRVRCLVDVRRVVRGGACGHSERMPSPAQPDALRGRVAVVAGATRGAGRGIAVALGEAGATVICTGRTSTVKAIASDYQRQETIEETADLVTRAGGRGVAVPVDHLVAEQVSALADFIERDFGHIDVLVNDIWGGELLKGGPAEWNTPIWKLDLDKGLRLLRLGIDTHLITSRFLLPLLIEKPGGLLVEVTDGTAEYNAATYRISVYYDLVKVSVARLAFSQGHELRAHGGTAVAITPGWLRSEMMLENYAVTE